MKPTLAGPPPSANWRSRFAGNAAVYAYGFLDAGAKREIRRKLLGPLAILAIIRHLV